MKIQGTINLDVRDISTTFDYGRVILNAGNKQISVQLTKEAAELLQCELCQVFPHTECSEMYKRYKNIVLMDNDKESVTLALRDLQERGLINKATTIDRLTTKECDTINDWRVKRYKDIEPQK